ncbi:glycosyltransferase [uncultured Coprobacter sp.]|uniref:glycosyltransferase n=1 Tax=uncultured Coprobacter sp. TaxID=1720550 RepID=UPI0025929453|nr:glycosyltransferase [uncultured Coprobacter sp.]
MPYFSVIIPVYNRPDEVRDLLESLSNQTSHDFEILLVEDGSTLPCRSVANDYSEKLDVHYYYKENEGRSIARNYGMEKASGEYFIFFDSDCVIPESYFEIVRKELERNYADCFGGPDKAHESFSDIQKAINYSMTSFLTTGGIRGGKMLLEKFTPRTFNMGFSRKVFESVGGFREMFSEDIDMSTRIRQAGFSIRLIRPAYVYHKRRTSLKLFCRQIYIFGMSRISLYLLYPDTLKIVHLLPAAFVLGSLAMIIASFFWPYAILPLLFYLLAIFGVSLFSNKNLKIAALSVITSVIQLGGYGIGFMKAFFLKILLGRGRDETEEIRLRKGK